MTGMCYENSEDQLSYAYIYALILKKNPKPNFVFIYLQNYKTPL